jgi:DnaJ-class molecular chaperone
LLPNNKKIKIKIPKWLQPGDKIVVSGKGFKISGWIFGKRWDLIVKPIIQLPKKLSKEEEQLWKQLAKLGNK